VFLDYNKLWHVFFCIFKARFYSLNIKAEQKKTQGICLLLTTEYGTEKIERGLKLNL
jgi:hypothetical protein